MSWSCVALAAMTACRGPQGSRGAPAPGALGRVAEALPCPLGAPERHEAACDGPALDPAGFRIDGKPLGPGDATPSGQEHARRMEGLRCRQHRVTACGVPMLGPPGSHALVCRDARGEITGPVRLIAPDGSVLVEGACRRHVPIGAWIGWRGGRVESVAGFEAGRRQGLGLESRDGAYRTETVIGDPAEPAKQEGP